jgi:chromosome partitioning protein
MATRIITIMNQKGGVGKTTSALNIGAGLALLGKRVLLIDLDPQANLSRGLGMRARDLSESVYELLLNERVDARNLVLATAHERLHLVPSNLDLSGADLELFPKVGRELYLKRAIAPIKNFYDYILIDCPPSLSLLTINAMVASSEALVPLQAHPFGFEGLGKLFEVVGMLRDALNPELRVSGVLVTMFDARTNVSRETLEELKNDERLAPHLFKTIIKTNIKIAESQKEGIPVVHFDAQCVGSKNYMAICEEMLEMENGTLASQARDILDQRSGTVSEAEDSDEPVEASNRLTAYSALQN